MNCLNILDATDPSAAMQIRIAVYREQIIQCNSYIEKKPEHTEYYKSVISHLECWIQICEMNLLQIAEVNNAIQ